jgi:hypothetical protein
MRKVFSITFGLIVLLSIAMGAQALESKTITRNNGLSASTDWIEMNGNMITDTYLSVIKTNDGTDISLDIYTWDSSTGNYLSEKSGYMFTKDDVFSIDKKLNSASLSKVDIEVYNWETGQTEIIPVKADWTGQGVVSTGSFRSTSKDGDYTFRSSDSSSYRGASVTGNINNCDLGVNPNGMLIKFKSASMTVEK